MNPTLVGVLAYVAVQLLIGAYVARRIRTEEDYLVAGRSLRFGLATFTIFATWFGAETCIGAAGAIYESGLAGGSHDPFGYALCLFLMGLFFAVPLWRRRLTTLADFYRQRYTPAVERVAVVLMVPSSLLWAAAQIRAFGQVLAAASGLEVTFMISVAAAVVVVYTISGGLLADAWTDLVQGIALMVGLVVLFVALVRQQGLGVFAQVAPERLDLVGGYGGSALALLEDWAIPVCGSVLAAELVARVIAARSPQVARRASLLAGTVYLLLGLIPVLLGLVGYALLPGLEYPEQVLPLLAERLLPPLLYTLFAGALVSAILSTVDSALLVAGSLVSHNLIVPLRPGLSERGKIRLARLAVGAFGVLAYTLALSAEGVYALVEEASAFGSAGIFCVLLFGLFSPIGRSGAALAALLAGVGAWVLGAYVLAWTYPYLASLAWAFGAYLAGALAEHLRPAPIRAA